MLLIIFPALRLDAIREAHLNSSVRRDRKPRHGTSRKALLSYQVLACLRANNSFNRRAD